VLSRFWTSAAVLTLAFSMASGAAAQVSADATATTTIADSAGIELTGEVIFQDILINPTASVESVVSGSNASVTLTGTDAVSLAVPDSFDLTREGGVETLKVLLMSNGNYTTLDRLQSLLTDGDALSIDLSGAIRVDASRLAPGEYRGLLVVVAQYN
jgi:hypothetical protein